MATADEATVVKFGGSASKNTSRPISRQKFTLKDPTEITSLTAQMIRDDGAVVFLNNHEVWRSNMPTGTIGFKTLATKSITGSERIEMETASSQEAGSSADELIAVELHQNSASSPVSVLIRRCR